MARRSTRSIYREFVPSRARFYCDDCGARAFPGDAMDSRTEAPEPGRRGDSILLRTYNAQNPDDRYSYCFSCKGLRKTRRVEPREVLEMYIKRRGVVIRE